MKVLVYGVGHWNQPDANNEYAYEWYDRIIKFIPDVEKVFVTTGCYSDPDDSPFLPTVVDIVQNNIHYTEEYSGNHNYFRNGFMTGIWNTLINDTFDWDMLIHVQPRVLIGQPIPVEDFLKSDKLVMCSRYCGNVGTSMEISMFAMKREAVCRYATRGYRNSFIPAKRLFVPSCEEEAYMLFHSEWYNPWRGVITTRQNDQSLMSSNRIDHTPFQITDIDYYKTLPFISTGKHATKEFIDEWRRANSYE